MLKAHVVMHEEESVILHIAETKSLHTTNKNTQLLYFSLSEVKSDQTSVILGLLKLPK